MKIKRLDYRDLRTGWHLKDARFDDFNLLVGVSGVGKTKIVQALQTMQSIATLGSAGSAARWSLDFELNGQMHQWAAATAVQPAPDSFPKARGDDLLFIEESVTREGTSLLTRTGDDVYLRGNKIPGLSARESCIRLLENDGDIRRIRKELLLLAFGAGNAVPTYGTEFSRKELDDLLAQVQEGIENEARRELHRQSYLYFTARTDDRIGLHIWLKQRLFKADFDRSIASFRSVFPSVMEVKAAFADELRPDGPRDMIQVAIREKGSSEWIVQPEISSGMLRVLFHIFALEAALKGSVFIIDEFENSLGDNCLSEMTSLVLSRAPEVQFILTSHHPYVINKIPIENWKLVQRTGSTVTLRSARDIPALMGKSHQDAFIRLINLPEFEEGIATADTAVSA